MLPVTVTLSSCRIRRISALLIGALLIGVLLIGALLL